MESSALIDEAPKVEEPIIHVNTVDNIGTWTMPITSQISNRVTLKFNAQKGKYYTLEKMSNANKTDSLDVIVTKKDRGIFLVFPPIAPEYFREIRWSYTVDDLNNIFNRIT